MSCNIICNITRKPLTTQYILLTYYLLIYLLKSNPGNPFQQPGTRFQNQFLLQITSSRTLWREITRWK